MMKKLFLLLLCLIPLSLAQAQDIKLSALKNALTAKGYTFRNHNNIKGSYTAAKNNIIIDLDEGKNSRLKSLRIVILYAAKKSQITKAEKDTQAIFATITSAPINTLSWLKQCFQRQQMFNISQDNTYSYKCFITGDNTVFMAY